MPWILIFAALLGHGFFWIGAVNRIHALPLWRWLLDGITYACVALFVALPVLIAWRLYQAEAPTTSGLAEGDWLGWYVAGCVLFSIVALVGKAYQEFSRYDRRALIAWGQTFHDAEASTGDAAMQGRLWKALGRLPGNEASQIAVDQKQLAVVGLPAELAGLKLIHLSDLHMTGRMSRLFYDDLTEKVCQLEPDVIALTGDIVENPECWEWFDGTLGQMRSRYGNYFVLGNHDLFVETEETIERLRKIGWTYVGGESLSCVWNNTRVAISGNELPWRPAPQEVQETLRTGRASPDASAEQALFHLALLHTPDQWRWAVQHGANLALAGHTHGGQICLPGLGPLASPSVYGTRYACGVFQRSNTVLHVSRGLAGMTPVRWNCPPELAVLELVPG